MKYVVEKVFAKSANCRLLGTRSLEKKYRFHRGVPLLAGFPPDVEFMMDRKFVDGIRPADFIDNSDSILVVSGKGREVIGELAGNEYLPVTIVNLKGRKEAGPFFILHQLTLIDAVDRERTVFELDAMNNELFGSVDNIVLDESRIDPSVELFRLKPIPYAALFREDLAKKIEAAGLTGIRFRPPEAYRYPGS